MFHHRHGRRRARPSGPLGYIPLLEVLEDRTLLAAFLRVNQVGYVADGPKEALLMSSGAAAGASFEVRDHTNTPVLTGVLGPDRGPWSPAFAHVYPIDFDAVTTAGTYTIDVGGAEPAMSPTFRIDQAAGLYTNLIADSRLFFRAQRDGPDVDGSILSRQPSHLTDQNATVYRTPTFRNGALASAMIRAGGPIDVSGGWLDAGDYLKFVETTSYAVLPMLMAARDHPALLGSGSTDFASEARFGLDWLLRMWDGNTKTLYLQVGLATGNNRFRGDHDVGFRLPQADDQLNAQPGSADFFVQFRPVFRANVPGGRISPNLAGRVAAAFALGFEVFNASDPAYAARCLRASEAVYGLAQTANVGTLRTTAPFGLYSETTWRDDMELGAAELYHALAYGNLPLNLPHSDPLFYLKAAASWAASFIRSHPDGGNLLAYSDVNVLAHYELSRALTRAGNPAGLAVTTAQLAGNLQALLANAIDLNSQDPFGLGFNAAFEADTSGRALGLALTANLFEDLTGNTTYAAFGKMQLDWVLGENAWGSSFMVGEGTVFPHLLHHQIANLAGSLDGTSPILRGAVVAGPVGDMFYAGNQFGLPAGANPGPGGGDPFAAFNGHGVRYRDDVEVWLNVEPALDYVAANPLLFAGLIESPASLPPAV